MKRTLVLLACVAAVCLLLAPAAASAAYTTTAECLACHDTATGNTVSRVDFNTTSGAGSVSFTACNKCHNISMTQKTFGMAHNHPVYYGAGCSGCHGFVPAGTRADTGKLPYVYVAAYYGYYATSTSPQTTSVQQLHAIHVNGSWPKDTQVINNGCAGCHAPASCSTCHVGAVAHATHSSTKVTPTTYTTAFGQNYTATLPNIKSETVYCAGAGCHALVAAAAPEFKPTSCTSTCHLGPPLDTTNRTVMHGGTHELNVTASNFDATTTTGCTNSGPGCHGAETRPTTGESGFANYQSPYHPASGCLEGPCHYNNATKALNTHRNPLACQDCHDDTYDKAPYVTLITAPSSAGGHYDQTLHTAGAASATGEVTSGGTAKATCANCHPTGAPGMSGLYTQHRSLGNGSPDTSCYACHSYGSAGVIAEITSSWTSKDCSACHNEFDMLGKGQHASTAPVVASTMTPCGASGAGCHASNDLHALHKNAAGGCNLSGCHVYTTQAFKPTKTGCGIGADCHTAYTVQMHPTDIAASHQATTAASRDCAKCHQKTATTSVDIDLLHRTTTGTCALSLCHNNATRIGDWSTITPECLSCHNTGHPYHADQDTLHTYSLMEASCQAVGCHSKMLPTEHDKYMSRYPTYSSSCYLCHANTTAGRIPADATAACSSCHTTSHPPHLATDSGTCVTCHGSNDAITLHANRIEGGCAVCHSNPTKGDLTKGTPTSVSFECAQTGCHANKTPEATNHFSATLHTASPFTATGQDPLSGGQPKVPLFDAGGKECDTCHTAILTTAHATTSTNGGSVTCAECHTNTTLNSKTVVSTNWGTKRCIECHTYGTNKTHGTYATGHVVPAGSCAGSGTGCHVSTDLVVLHNFSGAGGTAKYNTCYNTGCHSTKDKAPVVNKANSCGSPDSSCHKSLTNHGTHNLSVTGSNWNGTTQTGCTNSGEGCHGSETRPTTGTSGLASYENPYHPNNGCVNGACHKSASISSHINPLTCQACHDGTYTGAANVSKIASPTASGGHYNETTHTADAANVTGVVTAGGVAQATCANCHPAGTTTGMRGLYAQHRSLGNGSPDTSCYACHNYGSAGVRAEITSSWPTKDCDDCHNAIDMLDKAQHASTAPVIASTATPCGASGAGCHASDDLHAIHKNAAGGCNLTGCHIYTQQAFKPTKMSCGQMADCHTNYSVQMHPTDIKASHQATTAGSRDCAKCHQSTATTYVDIELIHRTTTNSCYLSLCHNNPTRIGNWSVITPECVSCHTSGGFHQDQATAHTFATMPADCQAAGCHSKDLPTEHNKYLSRYPSYASSCYLCHANTTAGRIPANATADCSTCHPTSHPSHVAADADGCLGAGCHAESGDAITIHKSSTYGGCAVCHGNGTTRPNITTGKTFDCLQSGCHLGFTIQGHDNLTGAHQATTTASKDCGKCHQQTATTSVDIDQLHRTPMGCAMSLCHRNAARIGDWSAVSAECASCHAQATFHGSQDASHTFSSMPTDCQAAGCHSKVLPTEHAKYMSRYPAYSSSCYLCHANTTAGRIPANATADCATCHTASHPGHVADNSAGCFTGTCHAVVPARDAIQLHKNSEHGACAVCHGDVVTGWPDAAEGKTTTDCNQSGCHAGATGDHNELHNATGKIDSGCQGCHYMYINEEHAKLGYTCDTCHASTIQAVQDAISLNDDVTCSACHPAVNGKNRHAGQNTMEFVSGNSGGHNANGLSFAKTSFTVNGTTRTWPLPTNFLKTGWTTSSAVTCDKCHTFSSALGGPHGAAVTVNMDPAYPGSYKTAYLTSSSVYPANVVCVKCHQNFSSMNSVHGESDHNGSSDGKCIGCHSQIPHAWRLPRLLAYNTDPAPYKSLYLAGISLTNYTPNGWSKGNCAQTGCGEHNSNVNGAWPSVLQAPAGTLTGYVKNASGVAIAGATVAVSGGGSATTDATGKYTLSLAQGVYTATASASGYATASQSVTVTSAQTTTANFTLTVATTTGTLSGTVRNSSSSYLSGVTVSVAGKTATTDSNGRYTITAIPTGTQSVTFSRTGYITQTLSATINTNQTTTLNCTLAQQTFGTISGTVTNSGGSRLSGVLVTVGSLTDTTDSYGNYSISNVPTGSQSVTFSRTGYVTQTKTTTVNGNQTTDLDCVLVAEPTYGTLSGTVTESGSAAAISGVTVTVGTLTATTNTSGQYTITNVPTGSQSVSFSKAGYTTRTLSATINTNQTTTLNTTLSRQTGTLSGTVTNSSGSRLSNVLVTVGSLTDTTDSYGNYSIAGVPAGSVSVTFSRTGYATQTKTATITYNQTTDLDCVLAVEVTTGTLTGTVTDYMFGALSGVTVSVGGKTATTDASGKYTVTDLPAGSQSVTFSKTGYATQTLTATIVAGGTATLDTVMAAAPVTNGTLSGTVTDRYNDRGISGVTVSVAGKTATTDSSGRYTITDIPAGTYSASYSKSGYRTTTRSVTITGGQTTTTDVQLRTR